MSTSSPVLALLSACAVVPAEPVLTPASFAQKQARCEGITDMQGSWVAPAPPVHVFGNTYDVGTCGITALLVTSPDGHVLLDSGMPEAADLVLANIAALGADPADVEWVLSSHEHLDHVGATAEILRRTGARAAVLAAAAPQMASGQPLPEDPQAGGIPPFEGFPVARAMQDGETLRVGSLAFTVHANPAHTPGSASWTWRSCEDGVCRTMAYADSLSTPAAEGYRFSDHPDYVAQVRRGFAAVAALPCDILLTPHPSQSAMDERLASGDLAVPQACATYARGAEARFDALLAREAGR
ncbi:subclass B3 metallo-beta-lactamase [Aurantiacibacter luteus]|uniref:Metallo-beta-lactamase domain-containing protein n=1 Tax=Aurantiacibacter luteus TaxID=1581420 RepID=A0A0G9MYV5_9SPHN|nr:subclass B3 metallo-beta-lactamase [Aurantiacibacter luteus]KLE35719.1 hypothetical protein AAW00_04825 [Aurantiacibacter luteus]